MRSCKTLGRAKDGLVFAAQNGEGAVILAFLHVAEELHAIELWHVEIGQNEVEFLAAIVEQVECPFAVFGGPNLGCAACLEEGLRDGAQDWIVIHDQDAVDGMCRCSHGGSEKAQS